MDIIELWHNDTKALISPEGAWITNLSDENGDVLFPRRQLTADDGSVKIRGGSHVCLPQFGPGGETELPQHGFGRTSLWEVKEQTEKSVQLTLQGGTDGYELLTVTLAYTLDDHSLTMRLDAMNTGQAPLRVAPAFHPYFALQASEQQVRVDDQTVDLVDLHDMQQQQGATKDLHTQKRRFLISSDQLQEWALWTDQLGSYVCVEPTLGGYMFLQSTPRGEELLQPAETKTYECRISWR